MWWKRLTPGLWFDATAVGLLPAFTIGRIGCTLVHDHIGRATDFALGVDYTAEFLRNHGIAGGAARMHNLGMYELMYLIPVNALILWMAFGRKKPHAAGLLAVLTAGLYAPVRFVLDYYRLADSDPRYGGFTFAQWGSIAAFALAVYAAVRVARVGKPAPLATELGGKPGGRRTVLAVAAANQKSRKART
jgi:phosphatidylglycerol:prolipoprotein diacylglycerol transferase